MAFAIFACACHDAGSAGGASPGEAASPVGGCPPAWSEAPVVDPSIAVPEGGDHVVLHASAKGSQDYVCTAASADGARSYAWSLRGPDAALSDCRSVAIGHHFASDAGPPEWQLFDGTYVVAHKAGAFAVDGGAIPWLLLGVDGHGGDGRLGGARYVQRVGTVGGSRPDEACDERHAGSVQKVPYEAQYFFYGP